MVVDLSTGTSALSSSLTPVLRPLSDMLWALSGGLYNSPSGLVGSARVMFGFMASVVVLVTCQLAVWVLWGVTDVRWASTSLLLSSWLLALAVRLMQAVVAAAL